MLRRLFGHRSDAVDVRAECFRQFFENHFGRSDHTSTIQSEPSMPTIDIETYVAPWDSAVRVFASVGLSYYTRQRGELAEVMLLVDAEYKVAASAFASIVGLLADEPLAFGLGEVYEGRRSFGRIASKHGKVAMVLVAQPFEEPPLFHVDCDGGPGHVFVLMPVSQAERDMISNEGWEAMEPLLDGVDVSDLGRDSVV